MFNSKSLNDEAMKNHIDRAWKIVKYEFDKYGEINSYPIKERDVIKFGRVRFIVKKIVTSSLALDKSVIDEEDNGT